MEFSVLFTTERNKELAFCSTGLVENRNSKPSRTAGVRRRVLGGLCVFCKNQNKTIHYLHKSRRMSCREGDRSRKLLGTGLNRR